MAHAGQAPQECRLAGTPVRVAHGVAGRLTGTSVRMAPCRAGCLVTPKEPAAEPVQVRQSERVRQAQAEKADKAKHEEEALDMALLEEEEEEEEETGYEEVACEVCGSTENAENMLLCDTCDQGYHMACLTPPMVEIPKDQWHCATCLKELLCEMCGGLGTMRYCKCGTRFHEECTAASGSTVCGLCETGRVQVTEIIGCRANRAAHELLKDDAKADVEEDGTGGGALHETQYYVKWDGLSYRRCTWILKSTAMRLARHKVAAFHRKNQGAATVASTVPVDWSIEERALQRRKIEGSGRREVYVKWRGLDYSYCTWEAEAEVDKVVLQALLEWEKQQKAADTDRKPRAQRKSLPSAFPWKTPPAIVNNCGSLHTHQLEGLNWLMSMMSAGKSAMLADEMGLGKTIQTATMLACAYKFGTSAPPYLVVVPLSTVPAWGREMRTWAPELDVVTYVGDAPSREVIRNHEFNYINGSGAKGQRPRPRFQALITSYEIALQDTKLLRRYEWGSLVVDEGHRLKAGVESKLSQALSSLKSDFRLLLTGTPLQNNLSELINLLRFLDKKQAAAIEKKMGITLDIEEEEEDDADVEMLDSNGDPLTDPQKEAHRAEERARKMKAKVDEASEQLNNEVVENLHQQLEYCMLRRLKVDVLGEMPPKLVRRLPCRLSTFQRQIYCDVLARNYKALASTSLKGQTASMSLMNIFKQLQKVVNHPYLIPNQEPDQKDYDSHEAWQLLAAASGKLQVLEKLLPALRARGHRTLIFSQMTRMLDIVEDFMDGLDESKEDVREHPLYYRLDGSTPTAERQRLIDDFNRPTCLVPFFLISTRAGSLGINLYGINPHILSVRHPGLTPPPPPLPGPRRDAGTSKGVISGLGEGMTQQ
ncbi:hypothetical protein CYMTET_22579, partial [Cymbomonas tetramitiformis]